MTGTRRELLDCPLRARGEQPRSPGRVGGLTMPKYLLLMHQRMGAHDELSPDEMKEIVVNHRAWARGLKESGAYLASNHLAKDRRNQRKPERRVRVPDGPYGERKATPASS